MAKTPNPAANRNPSAPAQLAASAAADAGRRSSSVRRTVRSGLWRLCSPGHDRGDLGDRLRGSQLGKFPPAPPSGCTHQGEHVGRFGGASEPYSDPKTARELAVGFQVGDSAAVKRVSDFLATAMLTIDAAVQRHSL